MATLTLDDVTKRYTLEHGDVLAVDRLNLQVDEGELLVLVGPSGCGKSTALRMIAGLEHISAGELRIDGVRMNDLDSSQRDIAMVFQSYALYPHLSVYRNIAYPLHVQRASKARRDGLVRRVAQILDLSHLLDRRPSELSGGQRQRVAMGRALVREPRAFLMDEPLSNLDAKLRVQMRAEISALQRRLGVTTVYVTHDQVEAMTMGDRVAIMRNGVLQQLGTPLELYEKPQNAFVASFIGSPPSNILDGVISMDAGRAELVLGVHRVSLPPTAVSGAARRVLVAIRPEHAWIVSEGDPAALITGTVSGVENLGSELLCHLHIAPGSLVGRSDGERAGIPVASLTTFTLRLATGAELKPGETVRVAVAPANLRFFDAESGEMVA